MMLATDSVRLYQWAAPVVCVAAVTGESRSPGCRSSSR